MDSKASRTGPDLDVALRQERINQRGGALFREIVLAEPVSLARAAEAIASKQRWGRLAG